MRQLVMIAEEFNVAVLIVNQVTANPDGMSSKLTHFCTAKDASSLAHSPRTPPFCSVRATGEACGREHSGSRQHNPSHAEEGAR
eukprot:scaffold442_cov268-Pinguiococcus_pyrenoidosus.AAC.26